MQRQSLAIQIKVLIDYEPTWALRSRPNFDEVEAIVRYANH